MNISNEDTKVTFGGVTQKQREVTPEAGKKEKQPETQNNHRTGDEEDEEPILTGMQWVDRVYFVLHKCLDSPDPNEPSHQPEEADWCEQGFWGLGNA